MTQHEKPSRSGRQVALPTRDPEPTLGHVRPFLGDVEDFSDAEPPADPPADPQSGTASASSTPAVPEPRPMAAVTTEFPVVVSHRPSAPPRSLENRLAPASARQARAEPRGAQPAAQDAHPDWRSRSGQAPPQPQQPEARQEQAPARTPSGSNFNADRILKQRAKVARTGWRRSMYVGTGGVVRLGPGGLEQRDAERLQRVQTPVVGSRRVVVLSRKGGVGKSTVALMLGHTFAAYRGDRVVALDGDPDAGSLGRRIRRETAATVSHMLADRERLTRYASIRGYTSQASTRLEVVASDEDPKTTEALGREDYQQAVRLLDLHYNLILVDTATGILDSATQGIVEMADQIVVVLTSSLDAARAASMTLDWLDEHGHGRLVEEAVAVVNRIATGAAIKQEALQGHFRQRCRAVMTLPWDEQLEAGAQTSLEDLSDATREAYMDLAAEVASGFGLPDRRVTE